MMGIVRKGLWVVLIGLVSCSEPSENVKPDGNIDEAVEMIQYSFEGRYSMTLIKESMHAMFEKFGIEPIKGSYLKIGNTLIEYRKQSNGEFQEMDLINDIILSPGDCSFDKQLLKSVKKFTKPM